MMIKKKTYFVVVLLLAAAGLASALMREGSYSSPASPGVNRAQDSLRSVSAGRPVEAGVRKSGAEDNAAKNFSLDTPAKPAQILLAAASNTASDTRPAAPVSDAGLYASADKAVSNAATMEKEKKACAFIGEQIQKGTEIKKYVKTSIQMGYDSCSIIKCSIRWGGNLKEILAGAVEAGMTSDVVSRCAIDGGADRNLVAQYIALIGAPKICFYDPASGAEVGGSGGDIPPMPIDIPSDRITRSFVSPSSF